MGFTGVTTTGIYCRPGCSARPKPDNCVQLPSTVAAEAAGFRACRRCRPELEPGVLGALNLPETVSWALDLLEDGHQQSDELLAARVGLSVRHLRRLFLHHLGATPAEIARSRRAHLARRLLDAPDLDLTAVATATGLNGPRQLHRLTTSVFKAAPDELRGRSRAGRCASEGITVRLAARGGLDPSEVLGHLGPRCIPGIETVVDGAYQRTYRTASRSGTVSVRPDPSGITVHLPGPLDGDIGPIIHRCRRLFGIDELPLGERSRITGDRVLGPLAGRHPFLRVPRSFDRFETVVRIILGQQVSVKGASTLAGRVARRAGQRLVGATSDLDTLFPTPDELADVDLAGLGLTDRRSRTITTFARAVTEGHIDLYQPGTTDDIVARWTALDGIGPWTAHLIAIRVLAHDDVMPAGDLGIRRAVAALRSTTVDAVTQHDVAAAAQHWAPHRTWAAQLLWTAADPTTTQSRPEDNDG